jgi:hypothetical protein
MTLNDLIDKQQITEVILRYCRAIDRGDRELLKTVYHEDAVDRHGVFNGPASEFMAMNIAAVLPDLVSLTHNIGNILIELNRPFAVAESYVTGYHRLRDAAGERDLIVGGRYVDRFEYRDGEWRIAVRQAVYDWCRADPANTTWADPPLGGHPLVHGRMDASDVSHQFLRELRAQPEDQPPKPDQPVCSALPNTRR